jgi:hypothetical protein
MSICIFKNCKITPCFGVRGTKERLYCAEHKEINHVNVVDKMCQKCDTIPSYGVKGTKEALRCSKHKEQDHVNVVDKMCLKCDTIPCFGVKGTDEAIYCVAHKEKDHVNVRNKKCEMCGTQPSYGVRGTKTAIRCTKHKEKDHVNVVDKSCEKCDTLPSFGVKGTKEAIYCVKHKEKDHVNVVSKMCEFENCDKQASYGVKNTKNRIRCDKHKEIDHVRMSKKSKCEMCDKTPTYGVKNTKNALRCTKHKEIDHVDVVHKLCEYNNCSTRAHCGPLFKIKTHCGKHKTNNEFIYNNPKCESCNLIPCYTDRDDNYPLRCEEHQLENDKNIIERNCKSCNLICMLTEDSLCNDCNEYITRKPHKRKETIIKNVLDANKFKYDTYDQIPTEACNKYRPDFVFDIGTHVIILEVDENQHQSYACECEQSRMINLFQDFGGVPVIFIRFNPDKYVNNKGERFNTYDKSRETRLLKTLRSLIVHIPKELLSVIYLYYNGDDGNNKIVDIDYENNNVNEHKMKEYEIIFEDETSEVDEDETSEVDEDETSEEY